MCDFWREWVAYASTFLLKKATSGFLFHLFKKGCTEIFCVWVVIAMRHMGLQNTGYFLSELVADNNSSLPLAAALPLKSELFCSVLAGPGTMLRTIPHALSPIFRGAMNNKSVVVFSVLLFHFFSHLWSFLRFQEVGVGKRGKHPSKFPQKKDFRYLNSENFITKWCEFIVVLSNSIWTSTNWWPETPMSKAMLPQGRENPVAPAHPAVVSQQAYWAPTSPGLWGQARPGLWRTGVGLCRPGLEELPQHPLFQGPLGSQAISQQMWPEDWILTPFGSLATWVPSHMDSGHGFHQLPRLRIPSRPGPGGEDLIPFILTHALQLGLRRLCF